MAQDEKDSKSKCEVRMFKKSACVSSDFVTAPSKLDPLQDLG